MMKRWLVQQISKPWQATLRWYLRKPRRYRFRDIRITVLPGVFHPGLFFSTTFVLEFLSKQDLHGKHFVELGCGSGIVAVAAARAGANVVATDINTLAVRNVAMNANACQVSIQSIRSDLFDNIPAQAFDWIVINPPYYPSDPHDEPSHAWYCGSNHEYFTRLFAGLASYMHQHTQVLMVLSDVCDLASIFSIAHDAGFAFEKVDERHVWTDGKNYLYWIKRA